MFKNCISQVKISENVCPKNDRQTAFYSPLSLYILYNVCGIYHIHISYTLYILNNLRCTWVCLWDGLWSKISLPISPRVWGAGHRWDHTFDIFSLKKKNLEEIFDLDLFKIQIFLTIFLKISESRRGDDACQSHPCLHSGLLPILLANMGGQSGHIVLIFQGNALH